jgi:hypothetical protein
VITLNWTGTTLPKPGNVSQHPSRLFIHCDLFGIKIYVSGHRPDPSILVTEKSGHFSRDVNFFTVHRSHPFQYLQKFPSRSGSRVSQGSITSTWPDSRWWIAIFEAPAWVWHCLCFVHSSTVNLAKQFEGSALFAPPDENQFSSTFHQNLWICLSVFGKIEKKNCDSQKRASTFPFRWSKKCDFSPFILTIVTRDRLSSELSLQAVYPQNCDARLCQSVRL